MLPLCYAATFIAQSLYWEDFKPDETIEDIDCIEASSGTSLLILRNNNIWKGIQDVTCNFYLLHLN